MKIKVSNFGATITYDRLEKGMRKIILKNWDMGSFTEMRPFITGKESKKTLKKIDKLQKDISLPRYGYLCGECGDIVKIRCLTKPHFRYE